MAPIREYIRTLELLTCFVTCRILVLQDNRILYIRRLVLEACKSQNMSIAHMYVRTYACNLKSSWEIKEIDRYLNEASGINILVCGYKQMMYFLDRRGFVLSCSEIQDLYTVSAISILSRLQFSRRSAYKHALCTFT